MTLAPHVALVAMILYLLLLFGVAQYAVHRSHQGRSIVSNPYAYVLGLCVYVTAWTFYGAIGRAATTGLEFLPIYLGPALAMLLGWVLLRKTVAVSKQFRLNSISDFISFRYGRSYSVRGHSCDLQPPHKCSLRCTSAHSHIQLLGDRQRIPHDLRRSLGDEACCGGPPRGLCRHLRERAIWTR